jgi:hypothetical protein
MRVLHFAWILSVLLLPPAPLRAQEASNDLLASWRKDVKVAPVTLDETHSIHAYFNASPESPDGRWVLYYASTDPTGHEGEIRVVERATGKVRVLARNVVVEDAHRAACQQWVSGGQRVVFHNVLKTGEWVVMVVDLDTARERILARGRQVGFGQPHGNVVPLYGPHFNPGDCRDLELVDVVSGTIGKTALTAQAVQKRFPEWVQREFRGGPVSVYIPMLSPDLQRVYFKMSTPGNGDFRSSGASHREGLLVYDLAGARFVAMQERWGHPAWHPDSRHILNVPGVILDTDTGTTEPIPNRPKLPGSHPSFHPDGRLFTSDYVVGSGVWAVGVGDVRSGAFVTVHRFDNSKGARSWRVSHPHPTFSADGRRLYFNRNSESWTRLCVAELPAVAVPATGK